MVAKEEGGGEWEFKKQNKNPTIIFADMKNDTGNSIYQKS